MRQETRICFFYVSLFSVNLRHLKAKYNLSDLEIFKQETRAYLISFIANKLKLTESTHTSGYAIRLINNKRTGFASRYTKVDSNLDNLEEVILQAIEASNYSPVTNLELPCKTNDSSPSEGSIKSFKKNDEPESNNFIKTGEELIKKIHSETGSVLIDLNFQTHYSKEELENSNDLRYLDSKKLYSFSLTLRETLESDFIEIYSAFVNDCLPNFDEIVSNITTFYKLSKKHIKIRNGIYPILFTSKAAKDLLQVIELALCGKQIAEKSSPWHSRLGSKVLSEKITIKQKPNFGYMARNHDQEGYEIKSLNLINNGILENFYFDLMWSNKSKQHFKSTGNGFRPSLSTNVEPNLLNMILNTGTKQLNEIIKNIDYGLLVDQTIGALTTSLSGEFSANIDLGFLITKGELIGRVKDTMISGNIYNALSNVIELSSEPDWHWSHIYNPDILLEGFHITSK